MEIEKAIESVQDAYGAREEAYGTSTPISKKIFKDQDDVIALLERGKKFEKMWETLKNMKPLSYEGDYKRLPFPFVDNYIVMNRLEKQYFPEEEK